VAWTLGIYAWRVQQLNVVTSLLAPVVMILSLATTVHVYEAFLGYRPQCQTTAQALAMSLRNIWRPCLFSALTTGAGLASLMCSSIPAVRLFGLYGALGVLLSFVFGISVTPLLLSWPIFDKWTTHAPHQSTWMGRLLATCTHLGWYRRKQILAAFSGISLLALIGLTQLHCNTNLLDFLNQDSELVHTSRLVDDRLIGVNTLTCRITSASGLVPPSQAYQAFLTEIENLDSINGVIPEAMTHDTASQAQTWDVTLRVRAIGSKQALNLLTTLKTLAQHHFGPDATLRFGGYFYGIVTESDQLVTDLIRSFALALSIITILIGIQLRSFKATLMSLVPNVLSVLWIFGLMGLIGIDLSTGTAMIACVVLGLAVDHTIHYLSSLHHNQHPNLFQAIYRTTLGVGPALVISTLILAAGFGVGTAGSFKPTIYFSLFTALAMLAALFCNLLGMPVLMNLIQSKGQCLSAVNTESDSSPFEEVPLL
jgi:predicted RND superfamily exporter protein